MDDKDAKPMPIPPATAWAKHPHEPNHPSIHPFMNAKRYTESDDPYGREDGGSYLLFALPCWVVNVICARLFVDDDARIPY